MVAAGQPRPFKHLSYEPRQSQMALGLDILMHEDREESQVVRPVPSQAARMGAATATAFVSADAEH